MVQTTAAYIYQEIKAKGFVCELKGTPRENLERLESIVVDLNITKKNLSELDMDEPKTTQHLCYLLQQNEGINFGLCHEFKMWKNSEGWQYGCQRDKGKGKRIQVYCDGQICKRSSN